MRSRAWRVVTGILLLIPAAVTAFSDTTHHVKIASASRANDLPAAMEHVKSQLVRRSDDFEQINACRRTCLRVCGHEHNAPYEYSNCLNHCYINTVECSTDREELENWMP